MSEQRLSLWENFRIVFPKWRRRLLIFLAVLGPSTITTMAGNDGTGVITYSLSGAKLGYAILFTIPALTILYAITQEIGSRTAIVTGKGLGDLIRERFGVRIALVVFVLLFVANFGTLLANIAAVKAASEMLNIDSTTFIVATILLVFLIITRFSYSRSQKLFLTGIVLYLAYIFSAIKGNPDWPKAMSSMFVPPSNLFSKEYIFTAMAVLGTTITPWGQFFVQSYMKDKKLGTDKIKYARWESYIGAFVAILITFFIIVATASTLHVNGIPLVSGEQAALAIEPFAGHLASLLFALGLINAAIIGMVVVSLSSSYAFTEFFGFQGSLDDPYAKSKSFYIIFLTSLILAGLLVITPYISLFKIVLYTQSLNGILLPFFFYFILKIVNNKEIMGVYTNTKVYNYIAITASVLIVLAGTFAVTTALLGL